jgi:ubiquinone/menaquinone biosynthesis C-methylase UbiE
VPKLEYGYLESMLKHTEKGGIAEEWDLPYWRHLHWGLYDSPDPAEHTLAIYYAATVAMTEHIVAAAGIGDGRRVLDVGCGLGGTLDHIRERNADVGLVGINIDERQLQRATDLVGGGAPDRRISFVTADGCRLPVADRSFDHVLAVECLFHFPSRRQFFREAARVLRPGGTLALSDFLVPRGSVARALSAVKRPDGSSTSAAQAVRSARANPEGSLADVVTAWFEGRDRTSDQEGNGDLWWGETSRPLTAAAYERLGRGAGFDLLVDDDVTQRSLPTYEAHRRLYEATLEYGVVADQEASLAGLRSCDGMAAAARAGDWQYHVLAFRRR